MNDFDLEANLRALSAPERGDDYWQDFPRQVTGALRARPLRRPARSSWLPQLAWGFSLAFGCFALGYFIGHNEGPRGFTRALMENQREFRLSLARFPEQFRNHMLDENGIQQLLPDQP